MGISIMIKNNNEELWSAMEDWAEAQREYEQEYDKEATDYWDSLTQEQQLLAFYSVCKRIYKGDIQDEGSYRHVLYSVFGFDMSSYAIGMMCNYMDIHNSIDTNWKRKTNSNES